MSTVTGAGVEAADLLAALDLIGAWRHGSPAVAALAATGATSGEGLVEALAYVAAETLNHIDPASAERWVGLLRAQAIGAG